VDHCPDFLNQHSTLAAGKKWWNVSGIYKIAYLNCRHFYYCGSSRHLGPVKMSADNPCFSPRHSYEDAT